MDTERIIVALCILGVCIITLVFPVHNSDYRYPLSREQLHEKAITAKKDSISYAIRLLNIDIENTKRQSPWDKRTLSKKQGQIEKPRQELDIVGTFMDKTKY